MPRREKESTGQRDRSRQGTLYHDDSESEENAASAGSDPSKHDADRDKHDQDAHDGRRNPRDDPPHRIPTVQSVRRERSERLREDRLPADRPPADRLSVVDRHPPDRAPFDRRPPVVDHSPPDRAPVDRRPPLTSSGDRNVEPSASNFRNEDHLSGFSVAAKVLLDKNVVTDSFLDNSAQYLKHNPLLVRKEDVSLWRSRARSALLAGDPELSRKLIQQAYLIELSQTLKVDGVERFLKQDNAFRAFIKGSYTTFLKYLNQAEDSGLLKGRRREMLVPWARFVYEAWGEDVLETSSLPPDSVSADWAAEASVEIKAPQLSATSSRQYTSGYGSSAPNVSRPPSDRNAESSLDSQGYRIPTRPKINAMLTSPPAYQVRSGERSAVSMVSRDVRTRPSEPGSRRERDIQDRDANRPLKDSATVIGSAQRLSKKDPYYSTSPQDYERSGRMQEPYYRSESEYDYGDDTENERIRRAPRTKDREARQREHDTEDERRRGGDKRGREKADSANDSATVISSKVNPSQKDAHYSRSTNDQRSKRVQEVVYRSDYDDYDDDDDDDDDDDKDNINNKRTKQAPGRKEYKTRPREYLKGKDNESGDDDTDEHFVDAQTKIPDDPTTYEYKRGSVPLHSEPRRMPKSQAQADSRRSDRGERQQGSNPSTSRPAPAATTTSSEQPANPVTRLSRLLIGFVGKKTFRECLDYYEDNPKLDREDLSQFQSVIIDLIRQERAEAAVRVTERWLMLREAAASPLGFHEWMKRLPAVPARQDLLRQQRETVLEAFREIAETPPSSASNSVVSERRQSSTATQRSSTHRSGTNTGRLPPEAAKRPAKQPR